ncbi:MAG: hypothetical protein QW641_00790 [Candidatus Aenigmatarchaeota archaeon]
MKSIVLLLTIIILIMPISFSYEIAFIVNATGRTDLNSLYPNEFNYFDKIKTKYINVSIVPDSFIIFNNKEWISNYKKYDLAIISKTGYPQNIITEIVKNNFTKDNSKFHAILLKATEGENVTTNSIKIVKKHPITKNYEIGEYSLGIEDKAFIYDFEETETSLECLVKTLSNNCTLYFANNLTFRFVYWGINTSESNIIDQLLFSAIDWLLNFSDYGIKIHTPKKIYFREEKIPLLVEASVNITEINIIGYITNPLGNKEYFTFIGSGLNKSAEYKTYSNDPIGTYIATAFVSEEGIPANLASSNLTFNLKRFLIKDFDYELLNENSTLSLKFATIGKDGYVTDTTANITIIPPSKKIKQTKIENNTGTFFFSIELNKSDYGNYEVNITAYSNEDIDFLNFSFYLPPQKNISLKLEKPEIFVNESGSAEVILIVNNTGTSPLQINLSSNVNWLTFSNDSFYLNKDESKEITIRILFGKEIKEGKYQAIIKAVYDGKTDYLPIIVNLKLKGILSTEKFYEYEIAENREQSFQIELINNGEGSLEIKNVEIDREIKELVSLTIENKIIDGNSKSKALININTKNYKNIENVDKKSGMITIFYDGENVSFQVSISIYKDLTEKIYDLNSQIQALKDKLSFIIQESSNLGLTIDTSEASMLIGESQESLAKIKSLLDKKNYKKAIEEYENLITSIENIKSKIENMEKIINAKKYEKNTKTIAQPIFLIGVITVVIIIAIVIILSIIGRRKELPIAV